MKNNFQSKAVPRGTRTIWRYLSALFLLFTLGIGNVWGANTPASAGEYSLVGKKPGGENKFYKLGDGVYIHRKTNSSWDSSMGMKIPSTNDNGVAVYLSSSMKVSALINKKSDKNAVNVELKAYPITNGSTTFDALEAGTDNSTTVAVTIGSTASYTLSTSFAALSSKAAENKSTNEVTFVAGYYYIVGTDDKGTTYLTSVTLAAASATAPAITAPTTDQSATYTVGDVITALEVTATGSPTPTYQWYYNSSASTEGATSLGSSAQTASYTPSNAAASDLYYYCVVSNSAGSATSHYFHVTVNTPSSSTHAITYNEASLKGADVSAYPTEFYEGIGIASFDPLADVTDFHFNGWSPASIGTDVATDVEMTATWVAAYDVTFNINGGTGSAPDAFQKWEGATFELPGQGSMVAPSGRVFGGWKAGGTKYAASAEYTMTNAAVEFVAQWDLLVEQVLYSWEGAEGGATEVGGTATHYNADAAVDGNPRVNYKTTANSVDYYTISLNGKADYSTDHIRIALTANAKAGDKVKMTAFYSKDSEKTVAPKIANSTNAELVTGSTPPNIYSSGVPALQTVILPVGADEAELRLTRSTTATNVFITKLQIVHEKAVPEEDIRTVTFNTNGGSAIAAVSVEKGTAVAQPADPTKAHCRFEGWQLSGSDYDFSSAVNSNITLDAVWTQLYTISFAAGDGSGDAPAAIADKAKDETFEVPANTFTAPASKEFDKWNDGSADYAPGDTYTVGTANVLLTAQWKALVAKYTVIFKDGETTLDTKLVDVGSNPSDAGVDKTKALFTFAAWQLSGSDIALDDASWASVAANAEVTLTARWAKAYATSYDMEAYAASVGASKAGLEEELTAANYAFTNINGIDNEHTHNYTYDGMKYKTTDGDLSFNVLGGKVVEVKTGHLPSNDAVIMNINGVADATVFEGADEASETHKTNYFYSAVEALYRLDVLASKGTCAVKAVTIRDPFTVSFEAHGDADPSALQGLPSVTLPDASNGTESLLGWFTEETGGTKIGDAGDTYIPTANITLHAQWESISTDARLASITLDPSTGVWEPAFNPEIVNYTYTMPYGTAAVPQITGATAVNAGGSYSIVSQASAWDETAVIRGVAASSDTKAYNITMKIAPKDGTCIVKAELAAGSSAASISATSGAYKDEANIAINVAKDLKLGGTGNYVKVAVKDTYFQDGDIVEIVLRTDKDAPAWLQIFADEGTTMVAEMTSGVTKANPNYLTISGVPANTSALYLYRTEAADGNMNPYPTSMAVYRAMNPILTAIQFNSTNVAVTGTTVSALLPNGTNLGAMSVTPTIYWNGAGTAEVSGSWAWGSNTYVVTDKDGDATTYTINLTEDVLKHTVSYYDGATLLGTEDVEDGEHPTAAGIIAPSKLGETFQGWSTTDGGDVEDLNDIAISADDELYAVYAAIPCPTSGTVYKFEIKDGLASENLPIATDMDMSSYIDATGIGLLTYSATANNKATINSDGTIQLKDATAAYLKVELACALAAGDQIRAHVSNNPIRVQVGTTYDSSKDLILDKNAYDIVDITAAMEGLKVLYIARSTNGNANLADFEIYRRPALTGASLADLTMRQGQNKTPELTLEPSADAIVTSQVWEIVGEPTNLTDAAINGTTGVITTGTLVNPANNGTISVKVTLNGGSIEATCTVTVVDAIVQADVTKSTIWDWHNTGAAANIQLTNSSDPKKNENFVLANVAVNNNASFESDKLAVEGEYMVRDYNAANPYFQGQLIQFHTTVAGVVRVKFSHTGSNKPARELFVNGVGTGDTRTQATGEWSRYVEVPAGDVSLTAFHVDPADGAGQQYIRIFEIEFLEKLDSRTEYAAGELGTACYEYDAVVIGATPYMVAGVNGNGYIVFDEITSGVIDAGYPYLFEAAGGKVFFCKPVGTTAAPLVSGEETSVKGMVGTFTGTTLTQGEDDICYFAGRHIWRVNDFSVDIDVDPHRCYVNYDVLRTKPAAAAAPGRRRVIMGVNGKDEAQGFENLNASETPMKVMIDGTLYIIRGEKKYDATGRLVK